MEDPSPMFTPENLELLRDGLDKLLTATVEFLDRNPKGTAADMKKILSDTDKMLWERIREQFDESSKYMVYDETNSDPVKTLAGIFNRIDAMRVELYEQADVWDVKERKMRKELDETKRQLVETSREKATLEHQCTVMETKMRSEKAKVDLLEKQSVDKTETISVLRKDANVTLWEKEKERILEEQTKRETKLRKDLEQTKHETARKTARLEKRISDLQDGDKKSALSEELKEKRAMAQAGEGGATERDQYKKKLFYCARDLINAQKVVTRMQRDVSGILAGLKRDFRIVHQKFIDDEEMKEKHLDKLARWLERLHQGFNRGDMDTVREELPDYYVCTDQLAALYQLPMQSMKKQNAITLGSVEESPQQNTIESLTAFVKNLEQDIWKMETEEAILQNEQSKKAKPKGAAASHPALVNAIGTVNTTTLIKHFPTLSVDFIKEQWANFKRYDVNGDGTLDLAEMMNAMTKTMGHRFSAKDVIEVMAEVDDDKSETLDFFEYVKVSMKIQKKSGNATIFVDGELQKNKKQIAKTCVIQ